jgi:hypothetical protein
MAREHTPQQVGALTERYSRVLQRAAVKDATEAGTFVPPHDISDRSSIEAVATKTGLTRQEVAQSFVDRRARAEESFARGMGWRLAAGGLGIKGEGYSADATWSTLENSSGK